MGISLKPEHLKLYRDIARLMPKYGRSDAVKAAGLEGVLEAEEETPRGGPPAEAKELADDLEKLGPTFIKLGQLLSTRPDLVQPSWAEALSRLQDDVEPFPGEEVEQIVISELGVRLSKAFSRFDREPLAAASLGQVHRAALRDGREVAVKIQRPGVRERIGQDLDALAEIADMADRHTQAGRRYEFGRVLEELRRGLMLELDYRREADNLTTLRRNLAQFQRIVIPAPVDDYTTGRVLTMEYVHGRKITALSPLSHMELDGRALADELFDAYLKQILVDGFFHADPHAGNVFITDDGRLALIDLGMVGQLGVELQERLLRQVLAISDGRGEEAAMAAIDMGDPRPEFRRADFVQGAVELTAQYHASAATGQLQVGRVLLEVARMAAECGLRLPVELTMLGRALLALDQVGRTLAPDFDPNAAIQRNAAQLMRQRLLKSASPGNLMANVLEMNDFVQRLPQRVNRVLDAFADNEFEVRIRLPEETWMLAGMQKISNRIAVGAIVASLIISAAMIMRIPSRYTLLGYPALAMVLFLIAAAIGLGLVGTILLNDVHHHRKKGG
ncbi:MAG TPA: AarF/UbiB family protein [Longimicrobiaceae bacterium]|nr:AarF/UbiB family protein [Longimicrobiaceae bacterium]